MDAIAAAVVDGQWNVLLQCPRCGDIRTKTFRLLDNSYELEWCGKEAEVRG
jgi:predicted RNA-binding Zn-ribbon protein involved in translation (DUF1610 family)